MKTRTIRTAGMRKSGAASPRFGPPNTSIEMIPDIEQKLEKFIDKQAQ
jgi:hypothetical protein